VTGRSPGALDAALRLYGIDDTAYATEAEMFDLVHAMRTRIITSPVFTVSGSSPRSSSR
jgi:fructose-bisphosphate aldolase class I